MNNKKFLLLAMLILLASACQAGTGPTLLMEKRPQGMDFTGGIGPLVKYKTVSAPDNFGGDMTMWGVRLFAGYLRDPEFGLVYSSGNLSGRALKFNLDMAGLTLEDSFREDARVKWRATLGGGHYELRTIAGGLVKTKGSFSFFEPMILGVLPMTRHIVLEFGAGYTFAGATGVRIEGLTLQCELLMGKF
ncbi:MAG: hypothetical protein CVV42_01325 [Candidatus Riflebacteria bacterium HGW-Riflebacteria-2]|jgi:hypothetical protein|nr:MAG: hypothetical protein CVV42_01325 [Candidatus Riflebacteria bacterium HGW-Riflebacteria-2]